MNAQWKEEVEAKIAESLAEIERGDYVVHQKGDCAKMAKEYFQQIRREARDERNRERFDSSKGETEV